MGLAVEGPGQCRTNHRVFLSIVDYLPGFVSYGMSLTGI